MALQVMAHRANRPRMTCSTVGYVQLQQRAVAPEEALIYSPPFGLGDVSPAVGTAKQTQDTGTPFVPSPLAALKSALSKGPPTAPVPSLSRGSTRVSAGHGHARGERTLSSRALPV